MDISSFSNLPADTLDVFYSKERETVPILSVDDFMNLPKNPNYRGDECNIKISRMTDEERKHLQEVQRKITEIKEQELKKSNDSVEECQEVKNA